MDLAWPPPSGASLPRVESVWKLADRLATDNRGIVRGAPTAIDLGKLTAIDLGEVTTMGVAGNIIAKLASPDVPYKYEFVSEIRWAL